MRNMKNLLKYMDSKNLMINDILIQKFNIPPAEAGGNSKTKGNSKISIIKLKDIPNSRGYKINRIGFSPNLKKNTQEF